MAFATTPTGRLGMGRRPTLLLAGALALLWLACGSASAVAAPALLGTPDVNSWQPFGPVHALAQLGGTTYVGGEFTEVGRPVGQGIVYDEQGALPTTGWPLIEGNLSVSVADGSGGWYTAGDEETIDGASVAHPIHINANGSVDTGFDPPAPPSVGGFGNVSAMAVSETTLYVGGYRYLAAYSRNTGELLWAVEPSDHVYSVTVLGSTVYAGGEFTSVTDDESTSERNYLAAFDASTGALLSWNPHPNGEILALTGSGSTIYAGGEFNEVNGGTDRDHLAAFNATTGTATSWNARVNTTVLALALEGSTLYVGGQLAEANGDARNHAAAFSTETGAVTEWNPDLDEPVDAIAISGSTVVLGGQFEHANLDNAGGVARDHLASFNESDGAATAWDPGLDHSVATISAQGSQVFVGGSFNAVDTQKRANLFAYNERGELLGWDPSVNGTVDALAASGSTVYAGGEFTAADAEGTEVPRDHLAAFDATSGEGSGWNPVANGTVLALAVSGSELYVGGLFTEVGGEPRSQLAAVSTETGAVDGQWNPEVEGEPSIVCAIAVEGSTVYVGGQFAEAKRVPRENLAAFNLADESDSGTPTAWDPSVDARVDALLAKGSTIYAGGEFEHANTGGEYVERLHAAAFDPSSGAVTSWNPSPLYGAVDALAQVGDEVILGGAFANAAGIEGHTGPLLGVNATSGEPTGWTPGPDNPVYALLPDGRGGLSVGGDFYALTSKGHKSMRSYYAHFSPPAPTSEETKTTTTTTTSTTAATTTGVTAPSSASITVGVGGGGSQAVVRDGRVVVKCHVSGATPRSCVVQLKIRVGGHLVVVGSFAGGSAIKLNSLGLRILRRHPHGLRLTLTATATVGTGTGTGTGTIDGTGPATATGERTLTTARSVRLFADRQVIDTSRTGFAFNSSALSTALLRSLRALATGLGPVRQVICTGHADGDGDGSPNHERALGLARAKAVCRVLAERLAGVRFSTASAGSDGTSAGGRTNRYVSLTIVR
jgi:outer membrane protein OmpA-like peptidoglycan-associated protein/nitrite reductase/ring-hydroxylating ferredoxin subunit